MNIKFKFVICVLLLFFPVKGFAETIYDQPYLGEFPDFFRERFSALALKQKVATNLATIVQQSDLIILAETEKISEALESSDRIIIYDANVKILKTFKNKPTNTFLHLEFKASATSIENNSKHIFFLKQMKDGYQVLKASYIFPRGQGYDNFMRIFGAYDCSENVGTDVINYLATLRLPVNIEENLINEYLSEDWGKMYSAVHMASATAPVTGNSVLKMAVSVKERKRFDIDLYGTAAYSLAVQKRQDNWRVILENIPSFEGNGRVAESVAFDLAATFGDENVIPIIKDLVSEKPEFAVSAAFALSKIGGKEARLVIETWLKNTELSKREELISSGWNQRKTNFSTLFREALDKMNTSKISRIF